MKKCQRDPQQSIDQEATDGYSSNFSLGGFADHGYTPAAYHKLLWLVAGDAIHQNQADISISTSSSTSLLADLPLGTNTSSSDRHHDSHNTSLAHVDEEEEDEI